MSASENDEKTICPYGEHKTDYSQLTGEEKRVGAYLWHGYICSTCGKPFYSAQEPAGQSSPSEVQYPTATN